MQKETKWEDDDGDGNVISSEMIMKIGDYRGNPANSDIHTRRKAKAIVGKIREMLIKLTKMSSDTINKEWLDTNLIDVLIAHERPSFIDGTATVGSSSKPQPLAKVYKTSSEALILTGFSSLDIDFYYIRTYAHIALKHCMLVLDKLAKHINSSGETLVAEIKGDTIKIVRNKISDENVRAELTNMASQYKKYCANRKTEGDFINSSLKEIRNDFATLMKSSNMPTIKFGKNILKQTTAITGSEIISIKSPLLKWIKNQVGTTQDDAKFFKSMSMSVFCVLNLTTRANDPPPYPYIDINDNASITSSAKYYTKLAKSDEILRNNISSINTQLVTLLGNPTTAERDSALNDIEDYNAVSALGTLDFLDKFSKGFKYKNIYSKERRKVEGKGTTISINNNKFNRAAAIGFIKSIVDKPKRFKKGGHARTKKHRRTRTKKQHKTRKLHVFNN